MVQQQRGGVAVEFAIIVPLFLLLVFGIVDFGHAWYMTHLMTNASREGARYGTRYWTDNSKNRILPKDLTPSVTNYVKNTSSANGGKGGLGLTNSLPADASLDVAITGPGATETNATALVGEDLTVTITAQKKWFVIGNLIPALGATRNLSVNTTMKCE